MDSSYAKNNFGEVFEAIVDAFKPVNCVELGILNGYSTRHISMALEKNGRGTITAYDIFEDYPFRHSNMVDIVELFANRSNVRIVKKDAFAAAEDFADNSVDFLHVDLSNTGEIVRTIMEQWDRKMVYGGIILFEGGTDERDQVEWMVKYNKTPLKPELESNPIISEKYIFGTYLKFPGLTMLLKKR